MKTLADHRDVRCCDPAGGAQAPSPVKWSIQKAPAICPGRPDVAIQFAAQIEKGWHLYALEQPSDGPIPTQISVGPGPHFTLDPKKIDKPEPEKINDENFGVETHHYSWQRGVRVAGDHCREHGRRPAGDRGELRASRHAPTRCACDQPPHSQKTTVTITAAKK